jgi:hypothetical protein
MRRGVMARVSAHRLGIPDPCALLGRSLGLL